MSHKQQSAASTQHGTLIVMERRPSRCNCALHCGAFIKARRESGGWAHWGEIRVKHPEWSRKRAGFRWFVKRFNGDILLRDGEDDSGVGDVQLRPLLLHRTYSLSLHFLWLGISCVVIWKRKNENTMWVDKKVVEKLKGNVFVLYDMKKWPKIILSCVIVYFLGSS